MKHNFELNNGVMIPAIGFGTYKLPDDETTAAAVEYAIKAGYRHIDGAAVYANEKAVGEGLRRSGVAREDLFVTSKVWNTDRGYDYTLRAFDRSLADLGLDYLDLYLIHWPASPSRFPDWKDINLQTWHALERLYSDGRVRAIGVSNFMPHHLQPLLDEAEIVPVVNQIEYHPGFMQPECVDFCTERGIRIEAWSPLGRGRVFDNPLLNEIAARYGKTVPQICLRWELQHGIIVLPKSATPERITANLDVWDFTLSDADMAAIDAMAPCGASGLDPDTIEY